MTGEEPRRLRPRWKVLTPVLVVGLGFVVWAVQWQGKEAWPGVFVNVGTGFLLAAVLVFAEPRFTRRLTSAVTKDVADQVSSQVAEATERRLAAHLDDMDTIFQERVAAQTQARSQAVNDMAYPTFEAVLAALDAANDLHALRLSALIVPASDPATSVRLRFERTEFRGDQLAPDQPVIGIFVLGREGRAQNHALSWQEEASADEMGVALVDDLRRDGVWEPGLIDWPLALRNLQRGLRVALVHREAEEIDKWASTTLTREYLAEHWILTDEGIESCSPQEKFLFSRNDFPAIPNVAMYGKGMLGRTSGVAPEGWPAEGSWPPVPPEGLKSEVWQGFLYRTLREFQPAGWNTLLLGLDALRKPGQKYVFHETPTHW